MAKTMVRTIAKSTENKYIKILNKYPSTKYNYNDPELLYDCLINEKNEINGNDTIINKTKRVGTVLNILSAILWNLRKNNGDHAICEKYSRFITDKSKKEKYDEYDNNIITDKLKTYNEYITMALNYKDNALKQTNTKKKYIMLKYYYISILYTLYIPRRVQDYALMKYIKTIGEAVDNNYNYFVDETGDFIFNKYKTAWKYGTDIVKYIDIINLVEQLRCYIKLFHIENNHLLFSNETFIYRALYIIFNTSVDGLRHAYVMQKGVSFESLLKDAKAMGHSIDTHLTYLARKNI